MYVSMYVYPPTLLRSSVWDTLIQHTSTKHSTVQQLNTQPSNQPQPLISATDHLVHYAPSNQPQLLISATDHLIHYATKR